MYQIGDRYTVGIADCGPFKGQWVVVDENGALAVNRSFASRRDAESEARWLNDRAS
jgi:hypothetical protein